MARKLINMRYVKDILRLKHQNHLSVREIAGSCGLPASTVGEYLQRTHAAGLAWPLPEGITDSELMERLIKPAAAAPESSPAKPLPDPPQPGLQHTRLASQRPSNDDPRTVHYHRCPQRPDRRLAMVPQQLLDLIQQLVLVLRASAWVTPPHLRQYFDSGPLAHCSIHSGHGNPTSGATYPSDPLPPSSRVTELLAQFEGAKSEKYVLLIAVAHVCWHSRIDGECRKMTAAIVRQRGEAMFCIIACVCVDGSHYPGSI